MHPREVGDGRQAVRLARELRPEVIVMDILNARAGRHCRHPKNRQISVVVARLVLTTFDADRHVYEAIRGGASGFLLKNTPIEQLAGAVHAIAAGQTLLSPAIPCQLIEQNISTPDPTGHRRWGPARAGKACSP